MSDLVSSHDLWLVIDAATRDHVSGKKAERGIPEVLKDMAAGLSAAHIDYALVGALARGMYGRPRATRDIDLVAMRSAKTKLMAAFDAMGLMLVQDSPYRLTYKDHKSEVEIDTLLGELDPERSAVADSQSASIFGVPVPLIKPEYLLWMYVLSDRPQHWPDGIDLVNAGRVDLDLLRRDLRRADDAIAERRLTEIIQRAAKERASTYSDSVMKRLGINREA